jgi:hypothetical protein
LAAVVGLDGVAASGVLAAITAWEALLISIVATITRSPVEAVVYPWVGVGFWALAYVFLVGWLEWGAATVTTVTLGAATVVSAAALLVWLLGLVRGVVLRWLGPVAGLGQVGLVGAGWYGSGMLDRSDALLAWAVVAGVEAVLFGVYATVRLDRVTAWGSVGLGGLAFGLFAEAVLTEPVELLGVTGPAGAVLLAGWLVLMVVRGPSRLVLWRWQVLVLAQAALATAALAAVVGLDGVAASGVLAAITAWEALLISIVATITRSPPDSKGRKSSWPGWPSPGWHSSQRRLLETSADRPGSTPGRGRFTPRPPAPP